MSFDAIDTWWWPFVFILIAGWAATDGWRFLGVYLGGKLSEESDLLVFVRCVATALVAAVIANLVVFPGGALADSPLLLRIVAAIIAFSAYLLTRKNILLGILAGEAVLLSGLFLL
ncbi:AzlD domain-containing protein [Nitratireductor indicus]|uniref:Branched-chain amino acid transport n=1 Tax=Nitratireductor indicus C115 TaxID=1231190 RepID=K2NWT2_9HYPH|nr:AzlD domain-containing protein [Nitratireductor indicus]EKF43770.1 branched-chain amino acid transport [Nitratireductor indicus C115]MDS1135352.1 AzlD domain-containing protein [Nitratireductor indicus]SFQ17317.1 Branched-chain amino acid transport protein (AzlD) [Nitratireductor indicus]